MPKRQSRKRAELAAEPPAAAAAASQPTEELQLQIDKACQLFLSRLFSSAHFINLRTLSPTLGDSDPATALLPIVAEMRELGLVNLEGETWQASQDGEILRAFLEWAKNGSAKSDKWRIEVSCIQREFEICGLRSCPCLQRFFNASMAAYEQYNMSGSCGQLPLGLVVCIDPCGLVTDDDVAENDLDQIPHTLSQTQQKAIDDRELKSRHELGNTKPAGTVRMAAKLAYKVAKLNGLTVMVPWCVLKDFGASVLIKNDARTVGKLPAWLSRANYPAMYAEWYEGRTARRNGSAHAEDVDPHGQSAASSNTLAASSTSSAKSTAPRIVLDFSEVVNDGESDSPRATPSSSGKRSRTGESTDSSTKNKQPRKPSHTGRPLGKKARQLERTESRREIIAELKLNTEGSILKVRAKPYADAFQNLQVWRATLFVLKDTVGQGLLKEVLVRLQAWQDQGNSVPPSVAGISAGILQNMEPEQQKEYAKMILEEALQQMPV